MTRFPQWQWNLPLHFNIGAVCTDAHLDTPVADRAAVVIDDDTLGVRQLTFRQLAAESSRFAQLLRQLRVEAGDRVLIQLANCIDYPTVFLGAMKRGAIAVPTSMLLTPEEVIYLANDSGATVLVTDPPTWQVLRRDVPRLGQVRHVLLTGPPDASASPGPTVHDMRARLAGIDQWDAPHPTRPDDAAYLVYTSGTTGYPKGVLHGHRALLGRQPSSEYWFDFRCAGDRVLHAGKFNWTYVLGTGLMDPLYRGHTAILHEGGAEADVWPRLIAKHAATIFIGVPTIYRHILQRTRFNRADVPTLHHCMSAGEQLSDEVLAGWRERFGLDIYEGLGMTECSYYMCETTRFPIRPGSAGFIQPGHEVKLLDPVSFTEVGIDAEGMLCIPRDDPALMLRYWNQPEEAAACFHGEWFLTGDYARCDADGYIWFLGRKDDLINSFGYRVSPFEVERVLKDHPDIADAAAVAEEAGPDKILVAAYIIARPACTLTADEFLAYGRQRLASYKAPKIVYLVDELPRTRNGKVLRRALTPALAREKASSFKPQAASQNG